MSTELARRLRQLEDRAQISEQVIKYAIGVDRRDWEMFADCFTDPVYTDYSAGGWAAGTLPRADVVAGIARVLDEFKVTQHISPNHVIEFDEDDPDRAVCHSYMYAQHVLEDAEDGDYFLLRGSYTNRMVRTTDGWRIEGIIQHRSWSDGNENVVAEALARAEARPVD